MPLGSLVYWIVFVVLP